MCIICKGNYDVNMTELNCSNCQMLESIPDTRMVRMPKASSLTMLTCLNFCPLLTDIPNSLEDLTELNCCPLLTTIPNLTSLTELYCSCCPLLTTIPDTRMVRMPLASSLINLTTLYCTFLSLKSIPDTRMVQMPKASSLK